MTLHLFSQTIHSHDGGNTTFSCWSSKLLFKMGHHFIIELRIWNVFKLFLVYNLLNICICIVNSNVLRPAIKSKQNPQNNYSPGMWTAKPYPPCPDILLICMSAFLPSMSQCSWFCHFLYTCRFKQKLISNDTLVAVNWQKGIWKKKDILKFLEKKLQLCKLFTISAVWMEFREFGLSPQSEQNLLGRWSG